MAAPGGGTYYNPDRLPPTPKVRRKPVRPTLRRRYNPDVRGSYSARSHVPTHGYFNPDRMPTLSRKSYGPSISKTAYFGLVGVEIDPKEWDAAYERLHRFAGRPLQKWAKAVWYQAMKTLDKPLKMAAPRAKEHKRKGMFMRAISARPNRLRAGEIAAASNGPRGVRAPHRYLVIMGTQPHPLKANTSKYRAKSGKSPWSVFPARGGLRPKRGPSSKRAYVEQNVGKPGRRRKGQIGPVQNKYKGSGKVIAWNANLMHPGHQGNKFMERVWSSNKTKVVRFVETELREHGRAATSFAAWRA